MGAAGGGWSNEAIKRVPAPAKGIYIWLAAIWASYSGGLHGFNTANISGTMTLKPFVRDFGWGDLSDSTVSNYEGWIVSSMLLVCSSPSSSRTPDAKSNPVLMTGANSRRSHCRPSWGATRSQTSHHALRYSLHHWGHLDGGQFRIPGGVAGRKNPPRFRFRSWNGRRTHLHLGNRTY